MVTGKCPGDNNFVCYKDIPCNGNGKCMWSGCSGQTLSNKCPGPNGFKCCVSGTPPTPTGSGAKIVSAARDMVGKWPYSWGGGNNSGATVEKSKDLIVLD